MSARHSIALAVVAATCVATAAHAQRDSATTPAAADSSDHRLACAASGTTLRAWGPGAAATGVASSPRATLDTTIVLAITDRTWTRSDVDAGVALGVAGTAGAHASRWRACAGASAHLGTVTARLRQVHGTIRLHADPGALGSRSRTPGDTSSRTPPAVPPRR